MELKPGYKQTEVGVIPEDWETRLLGEGIKLLSGHHVLARHCNTDADGVPYITGPADFPEGVIRHTKFTTKPGTICRESDVLVTVKGSGAGTLVLSDSEYCISRQLMAIRVTEWNTCYIYFLLSRDVLLFGAAATGLIPGLSRTDILNKIIPLPPTKAEQDAIAEALSDTDALIESLEQLIAKKRHIKQGAMQELLTGKKRLPGFNVEWSTISMRKHASLKARIGWQALTTEEYLNSGTYYLVTGTDFISGHVNWSTCHFVDEWRYKQDRNIQLRDGDVLLTKDGTIGKVGYVENLLSPATLNSGVFVIRPLETAFAPLFLFYILRSKIFDEFISKITAGSTITHLYQKDFVTFEFLAPVINEQTAIATILSDMDAEIAALETKLVKTRALKQGMMHNLLTGRIRLPEQADATDLSK